MKKINILFIIALSILTFVACDDSANNTDLDNNPIASKLTQHCTQNFIVTDATDQQQEIGTWIWTKAEFDISSPIEYAIVVDTVDTFSSEKILATYNTHSEAQIITIEMLNTVATTFIKKSKPIKLYVAVKSYLGTSGNRGGLYSNIETINFTSFYFKIKDLLYILGDGLINSNNTPDNIGNGLLVLFADTNGSDDLNYTFTGYFKGGKGLKFPTIAGDDTNTYGFDGSKLALKGENYTIPAADGLYTLSIDMVTKDINMVKYTETVESYTEMDILGDFSSWTSGTPIAMTQVVPHVWVVPKAEISKDGAIKMRANKAWTKSWGFVNDKIQFPYGIATSDNGENIPLKAGTYYIALNDITGHYIIIPTNELPQKK